MPENPDTHVYRTYDKVLNEGQPARRRNHPTASGNPND